MYFQVNLVLNLVVSFKNLVPAIPSANYLTTEVNKRRIQTPAHFKDFQTKNFVERYQHINNSCYKVPVATTDIYKNSFFPRTISDWNQVKDTSQPSVEVFRKTLQFQ